MADDQEKTEEPTPKKIEDAKKEGNVSKSMEVSGATILFFGTLFLLFFSGYLFTEIQKMMLYIYSFIGKEVDSTIYYQMTVTVVEDILYALAPFLILVLFFGIVSNLVQFGFIFTPIKLKFEKLDPIKGMGNVFSMKKLIEALKLSIKLTIIFIVMVVLFLFFGDDMLRMMDKSLGYTLDSIYELLIYFLSTILLIIIIFAIIDYYFTHFYYMKSLRMSKQEIKDEYKNMEGDPLVKSRIRQLQMKMAMRRMMSDVPSADVVITNPTHYAVALKYDNTKNSAPKVVAKGIDFLALRIREIAMDNDIPIIENPALARAMYAQVEIEAEIPEEFYKAIAEIFSYVYELKKGKK
ncbi:flagellar biosynthesis protein FlhB [Arcobacter sp. FWKO B]|uniref:flagellar biosynthesis protein FlhB n=1 Tax=Arcobacter sp. FWKO B TaxID=2593672 RepID=UPI0018A4F5F1|nr:flagellar biosynthesis protein FlhB [Arcobacter sp. FWKO B]QOG12002.1 flagellar biosynthesis protein FlhB [Arcobacter sp. FWKO B]